MKIPYLKNDVLLFNSSGACSLMYSDLYFCVNFTYYPMWVKEPNSTFQHLFFQQMPCPAL